MRVPRKAQPPSQGCWQRSNRRGCASLRSKWRGPHSTTFIYATPAGHSTKLTRQIRKEHDDTFDAFSVDGATAFAQSIAPALVGSFLAGATNHLADAVRPTLQTGGRTAGLQRRLLHWFRHARRSHYVGAVRRRMERD